MVRRGISGKRTLRNRSSEQGKQNTGKLVCPQNSLKLRIGFMGTIIDTGARERGGARFYKLLMTF